MAVTKVPILTGWDIYLEQEFDVVNDSTTTRDYLMSDFAVKKKTQKEFMENELLLRQS
jgi:hypothetical protein